MSKEKDKTSPSLEERIFKATEAYTFIIMIVCQDFSKNEISRDQALLAIYTLSTKLSQKYFEIQSSELHPLEGKRKDEQLIPGLSGSFPIDWFDGERTFQTGKAYDCVVATIINPTIGMSAAHIATISPEVHYLIADKYLEQPGRIFEILQDPTGYLSSDSKASKVTTVVNQALQQFQIIPNSEKFSPSDTMLSIGGMSYLRKHEAVALSAVANTIALESLGKGVKFQSQLGLDTNIIYGGPNNPKFPEPTFI